MVPPVVKQEPPETPSPTVRRAGYVALVGRPNVGKSTLMNKLVGEDLSIVSSRPETTRDRVMAVVTAPAGSDAQLVIVDTPGVHRPHRELGTYMNAAARAAAEDADAVIMVVDATDGHAGPERESHVLEVLAGVKGPVILAVNKVDAVKVKNALLPLLDAYGKLREFHSVVPISAAKGDGVDRLLVAAGALLPESVALFPVDTLTQHPERFFVAERVREAVIAETQEEIPYVSAVTIESYDERPAIARISGTIHVERPGQKKIVVGTGGERIKAIGSRARASVERLLGRKVHLELTVKVTADWTRSPDALKRFGYEVEGRRRRA
jgi:GTP-binding protein Era